MVFHFIKDAQWLQSLYVKGSSLLHPMICHNIGKLNMIKKAFHMVSIEQVEGSYFEFGVYEGTSLLAAVKAHQSITAKKSLPFYKQVYDRQFFGFDSFDEGFRYSEEADEHPFFMEGDFTSSFDDCQKRFKKYDKVTLVKGYFEQILEGKTPQILCKEDKCAIVFIDCDLMHPSFLALDFVAPALQEGSVVILDDYFSYKGDPNKGVSGAWQRFLTAHPNIKAREFHPYGYTGLSFIIYEV